MQNLSQLEGTINSKLESVVHECEMRTTNTAQALGASMRGQVAPVADDVRQLKEDMRNKASACDVTALRDEMSLLKHVEPRLLAQVSTIEQRLAAIQELQQDLAKRNMFTYDSYRPLKGIIAHLTDACGGNVHKKGVVGVMGSSVFCYGNPENALDLESDLDFCSHSKPNSWICYDFKDKRVKPTSYSIKSFKGEKGQGGHPKSWVLEGSTDGTEGSWKVIDSRTNNHDLNAKFVIRNFPITPEPRESFRFVRLRQTGMNHAGSHHFILSSLEIFGTLSL